MKISKKILFLFVLLSFIHAHSTDYYVAPDGNDSANNGSIHSPLKTIIKAVSLVGPGDNIYLREGTYYPHKAIRLTQNGSSSQKIGLMGYNQEKAIIDGSQYTVFDPDDVDNCVFRIAAGGWQLKNLEIRNAQKAPGIRVTGSSSQGLVFENISIHGNGGTGLAIDAGAGDILVLNCDSYKNYDAHTNGENADGFGAKFDVAAGIVFRGCRAWANSDDGYDCWKANERVTIKECWAYDNGFDIWGHGSSFTGNGNGFKLGQQGGDHILIRCAAWGNRVRGFDSNGNTSGVFLYNCTAYDNPTNFAFTFGTGAHILRNCLSHEGAVRMPGQADHQYNSWNVSVSVSNNDFLSLNDAEASGARPADGGLPQSDFLRLATDSDLIDAGIDVGLPFSGANPDLGAFEYSDPSAVSKNEQCSAPPNNTPAHFCLGQNYPNPFNPMTTITFELSKGGEIDLCIYNSRGELVSDVINHEYCKMGVHMRNVNLSDCPAGLYVAVLEHNSMKESIKMMLLK